MGLFGGRRSIWVRPGTRNYAPAVEAVLGAAIADARIVVEAGDLAKNNPLRVLCERSPRALAFPCYADDERTLSDLIERTLYNVVAASPSPRRRIMRPIATGSASRRRRSRRSTVPPGRA